MSGQSSVRPAKRPKALRQADVIYSYDGSFEGFLSCVFESFLRHELPFAIWTPAQECSSLYPILEIPTDPQRADRVFRSLAPKLGRRAREAVMLGFLSGNEDKELALLRFLHFAFPIGPGAIDMTGNREVAPVFDMRRNLMREVDKLMGFVRFEESGGMLGAVIHPYNYVLPLLRGHFCARFPEESFVIYDATHGAALLYQDHHARLTQLAAPLTLPPPDEKEQQYQSLWKQFYRTLEIEARHNEACRMNHCPKRYWADMTELRGEL